MGLDLSAGTGAHLEVLAPGFPSLQWTATEYVQGPSDRRLAPSPLDVIDANGLQVHDNVLPSLPLDLTQDVSEWHPTLQAMKGQVRLAFCCNVIHISPWRVAEGIFRGAKHWLKQDGVLALYGPYAEDGVFSSDGNLRFDAMLRARNAEWGIRDLKTQIDPLAANVGLKRLQRLEMPANNLLLLFGRV